MSHPLMEIHFEQWADIETGAPDVFITRHRYHVPQRGDYVEVIEEDRKIEGKVQQVSWYNDETVVVSVK